jgi:DNA-binding NarL/FixJ family response regulator
MKPLRLLLADDHTLVRAGIRALLQGLPDVEVVGEAGDGHTALRLIGELRPDIALVDISMPGLNGIEVATRATKAWPRTRIIMLSIHADDQYARRALAAGAVGYLLKNAERSELDLAVRSVAGGTAWLSPAVSKLVLAAYARGHAVPDDTLESLTPRQREVLQLIAEGNSTKAIARKLAVSAKTVETHRAQLMDRLDIHDIAGLVRYAIRTGIVQSEP